MSAEAGRKRAPLDLRLLLPAGCSWAVTLWALHLTRTAQIILVAALGVLTVAVLGLWGRHRRARSHAARLLALSAALCGLCVGACAAHSAVREAGPVAHLAQQRATGQFEAVVVSDPRVVSSQNGFRHELVVTRIVIKAAVARGVRSTPSTPVVVFGDASWLTLRWHQRVRFSGRLQSAERGDDVVAIVTPRGPPLVVSEPSELTRGIEQLRSDLRAATSHLPADPRGLVPALVIGDTSRLPPQLDADMRATGMTHLNAVSGSNVSLVVMSVLWAAGWLRVKGRWRVVLALCGLALFVMLCRPEPSVVRAAAMGIVGLLGLSASRRAVGPAALAAAIIGLLLLNPWLAASYGFALSSLATAGLLFFARPWGDWCARLLPGPLKRFGDAVAIPIAAQATCAPVIVLLQSSVSLVGLPANLVAAPLVAPATFAGVATVLLAPLGPAVSWLPSWIAALPAWGIACIAHVAAAVPGGTLPWPAGVPGALLLCAVTLLALVCGPFLATWLAKRPLVAAAFAAVLVAGAWPVGGAPNLKNWAYVACDVGQGDGGLLSTTPGHAVAIDTGPDPTVFDACLDRWGITTLDAVVLTHFHADHVGGLAGALKGRTVGEIFVTSVSSVDESSRSEEPSKEPDVYRIAAGARVPVRPLHASDVLQWNGIRASVLWPQRVIHAGSVQNNASVTLDVTTHGMRMLFTGDLEREAGAQVRRELGQHHPDQAFAMLKVAHHGSANQDADLLRLVRAPIAVISVGKDNDYGHPSLKTLDLLRNSGSTAFRTDQGGDVVVTTIDGRPAVARPG